MLSAENKHSSDADQVNLTMALRTLRLSKSNLYATNESDVKDKCRRIISLAEVGDHDTVDDCWIVLYDRVYDVTQFLDTVSAKLPILFKM
jgi:cytochrome b involved in lipid metabolism